MDNERAKIDKSKWPRIILHADMDAFFAAVEQLDNPKLRGKPVLVGGTGNRGVVSTASYEARPFKVGSAMPMAEARRRCKDAIVLPPRFERYSEISGRIMAVFKKMSPLVEPLSLDEAFIDMSGSEKLFGSPFEMATTLKENVVEATGGLTVSVGVASTKFVAKVASDFKKPDGLTMVEHDRTLDFLWPLEIKRLWGVGPKAEKKLLELGFKTIGDVAKVDEEFLKKRLGSLGSHIWNLARGHDPRGVETQGERKSVGAERTLEKNIIGARPIRNYLRKLSHMVAANLRKKGLRGSGVRIKLKTSDFEINTRQGRLGSPTDTAGPLEREASRLLDKMDLTKPIRLVGLAAFDLESGEEAVQPELFLDASTEKARDLDKTLDALKKRFGSKIVFTGENDEDQ